MHAIQYFNYCNLDDMLIDVSFKTNDSLSFNIDNEFFSQLFLLHMDEIIPNVVDNNNSIDAPIGCSTICVNEVDAVSKISSNLYK